MVTIIGKVTTLPPEVSHHSHPSPSLHHHYRLQEEGPGTPVLPAPVLHLAPLMVTTAIIRIGNQALRERGKSTETGLKGRLHLITRTGGERSIMMTEEGKLTLREKKLEGDPAVAMRIMKTAETSLRVESRQVADTLHHLMEENAKCVFIFIKATCIRL